MKTSKDYTPAKVAIEKIEAIDSQAELDAFVTTAETRKTVLTARDARFAALTEGSESAPEVDEPEVTEDASEDNAAAEEETQEEETPETVAIYGVEYNTLAKAVQDKLEEEKTRFLNGQFPEGSNEKEIQDLAAKVFTASGEDLPGDEDEVQVPAEAYGELVITLQAQLVIYKSRRGLSTPSKIDKALIDAVELVSPDEE